MQGRIEQGAWVPTHLDADTVRNFADLRSPDGAKPIIVVNACQAGRLGRKLTGVGGFAESFLLRGAGAFLGALWQVGDQLARTFTETWYAQLLKGDTVARATIAARKAARQSPHVLDQSTWLAYVVYAHPGAVLRKSK